MDDNDNTHKRDTKESARLSHTSLATSVLTDILDDMRKERARMSKKDRINRDHFLKSTDVSAE